MNSWDHVDLDPAIDAKALRAHGVTDREIRAFFYEELLTGRMCEAVFALCPDVFYAHTGVDGVGCANHATTLRNFTVTDRSRMRATSDASEVVGTTSITVNTYMERADSREALLRAAARHLGRLHDAAAWSVSAGSYSLDQSGRVGLGALTTGSTQRIGFVFRAIEGPMEKLARVGAGLGVGDMGVSVLDGTRDVTGQGGVWMYRQRSVKLPPNLAFEVGLSKIAVDVKKGAWKPGGAN